MLDNKSTDKEALLDEMAKAAVQAAKDAWAERVYAGEVGGWRLPADPEQMRYVGKIFQTAYGMAVLDTTLQMAAHKVEEIQEKMQNAQSKT